LQSGAGAILGGDGGRRWGDLGGKEGRNLDPSNKKSGGKGRA